MVSYVILYMILYRQEETKDLAWDVNHKLNSAVAMKRLKSHESQFQSTLSQEEELIREDLASRVEVLENYEKNWADLGPTVDCIVFHDGKKWRLVYAIRSVVQPWGFRG